MIIIEGEENMSRNPVLYNSLVVGVIVLFIGIGIQPAFAVTTDVSDSDVCDICPKVSKSYIFRIRRMIDRLVKYDNQLSGLFNHILKNDEEFLDLHDKITPPEKISSNNSICNLIYNYFIVLFLRAVLFSMLLEKIYDTFFPLFSTILDIIYELLMAKFIFVSAILVNLNFLFDCPDWYWPPPYEEYNTGV